jgi:anti-anti-sigma factor
MIDDGSAPAGDQAEMPQPDELGVDVADHGDTVRVRITGELDALGAAYLDRTLLPLLEGPALVLLDLDAVSFVDSSGIRSLMLAHQRGAVRLVNPSPTVAQTFGIAHVGHLLEDDGHRSADGS